VLVAILSSDSADFLEHAPPQVLCFGGQADALIVGEAQPTRAELFAEDAILGLEIVDDLALLLQPASATTRNRSGCDSGGMRRRVADQPKNGLTIE